MGLLGQAVASSITTDCTWCAKLLYANLGLAFRLSVSALHEHNLLIPLKQHGQRVEF